jgi:hypothetical protein
VHIYTDSAERHARARGALPAAAGPQARASDCNLGAPGASAAAAEVVVVDFFDADGLAHFMHHTEKQQDGALPRRAARTLSLRVRAR